MVEARAPMDEDIKDFFQSMADELRAPAEAPSGPLLRRVRRRRFRTVGSALVALAVGFDARIRTLIEHWDGRSWSVVPSANFIEGTWRINALTAVDGNAADDVWAVGWTVEESDRRGAAGARALIEHWNGSTWSLVTAPSTNSNQVLLNDIAVLGSDDVWAVGQQS